AAARAAPDRRHPRDRHARPRDCRPAARSRALPAGRPPGGVDCAARAAPDYLPGGDDAASRWRRRMTDQGGVRPPTAPFARTVWMVLRKDLTVELRSGEIAYTTLFFAVS